MSKTQAKSKPSYTACGLETAIAILSVFGIAGYLCLKYGFSLNDTLYSISLNTRALADYQPFFENQWGFSFTLFELPLLAVLFLGGGVQIGQLSIKLLRADLGADLLAGMAIVTSLALHEYLAGALIVFMLAGGALLESFAVRKASSVLEALANRMPFVAHRHSNDLLVDIAITDIAIGDTLSILPHEICPVDGTVIEGAGTMDESYLTGEPYLMSKVAGSKVMSGAINGGSVLVIHADKLPVDSRYAKIMTVMQESDLHRPKLRRLGDQLGAGYAPLALVLALLAWGWSGDAIRFLAVLVIATPCPLLIGIPVAVISSISLAARSGIIIKNPAILETIGTCRTAIFDKTGTLTYGRPELIEVLTVAGRSVDDVLALVASLERYSKHPLAGSVIYAADKAELPALAVSAISELPGSGLQGCLNGVTLRVISRKQFSLDFPDQIGCLPCHDGGLECVVVEDGNYLATLQFRDEVRHDSSSFINHLQPNHLFKKVMLVSGDRESEVRYLADKVGISEVFFGQSPEQKLALVRKETQQAKTVFLGDGINDAPALAAATIGIAFGQNSDVTSEAADAVILDSSLLKVDELLHIGSRMRLIALQSAIGGMALSVVGMVFAGLGYLNPVMGAVVQEIIDVLAILNALRAAIRPKTLSDY